MSECSHYILDSAGTRVGCHFDELGEGHTTDDYFFLVNGTSSNTDIPFLDFPSVNGPRLGKGESLPLYSSAPLPAVRFMESAFVPRLWRPCVASQTGLSRI